MMWGRYWRCFLWTLAGALLLVGGLLWVVDPYSNLPGSPPFDRTAMASNQRYSYPAVARDRRFDSAVIGTSTARMLEPAVLNKTFGGGFANLAMNSATAYEQDRLTEVFQRARAAPRTVLIGLDSVWCTIEAVQTKYTFRAFPEWMYDESQWNDVLHMLAFKSFEDAGRQAAYLMGMKEAKYGPDGYANFPPPDSDYNLAKVRQTIYGGPDPKPKNLLSAPVDIGAGGRSSWFFPSHALLRNMLSRFPPATKKILFFVPYHFYSQPASGTQSHVEWQECKYRLNTIAATFDNAALLDFMIQSPLTTQDSNYWDTQHYSATVADWLVALIARGARNEPAPAGQYRILDPK